MRGSCWLFWFLKKIETNKINKTLNLMKFRGPDNKEVKQIKVSQKTLYFLHSRLSHY